MKVFGKLRPNAAIGVRVERAAGDSPPIVGAVRVIDCKNGQVTLGFEGPPEMQFAPEPGSDPTPAETA